MEQKTVETVSVHVILVAEEGSVEPAIDNEYDDNENLL